MGSASSGFHEEKKGKSHNITPGASERKKENRALLQRPPLSYLLNPGISDAYRSPPLLLPSIYQRVCIERYKLSLVLWGCWNINWRERHCCRWVIYLALFIKKRGRLKGFGWYWRKKKGTWLQEVTYVEFHFFLLQLSEVYTPAVVSTCACHCTDMSTTNGRHRKCIPIWDLMVFVASQSKALAYFSTFLCI